MSVPHYRPLPNFLTLAPSDLDGYGVFASQALPSGKYLGASHYEYGEDFVRTPLGGYLNFGLDPNVERRREGRWWQLYAIRDIPAGEELLILYRDYNPLEQ